MCRGGFVVFKQKTAYELRMSDWSSDVCSSDLAYIPGRSEAFPGTRTYTRPARVVVSTMGSTAATRPLTTPAPAAGLETLATPPTRISGRRSEEHTSELQSLMRISYAVFCLKKQNTTTYHYNNNHRNQYT